MALDLQKLVDSLTLKLSWEPDSVKPLGAEADDERPIDDVGPGELSSIARKMHQQIVQRALYSQEVFREPCRIRISLEQLQLYAAQLTDPTGRPPDMPNGDDSELLRLSDCTDVSTPFSSEVAGPAFCQELFA